MYRSHRLSQAARRLAPAVAALAQKHFGHHATKPVSMFAANVQCAAEIRKMPLESQQRVIAELRRDMESPLHPADVRAAMADLLGLLV